MVSATMSARGLGVFLVGCLALLPTWGSASAGIVCDFTIGTGTAMADARTTFAAVKPGDTVCIAAGRRDRLTLRNFNEHLTEAPDQPITFINYGGQVVIESTSDHGISIENSHFIRLTGTGDPGLTYGVRIARAPGVGVHVGFASSDFEIDHIEVTSTGGIGMSGMTEAVCSDGSTDWRLQYDYDGDGIRGGDLDDVLTRADFTQRNSVYHDNFLHDIGTEGFYVGSSFYEGITLTCASGQETGYAPLLEGVQIHRNRIERSGWDGIQVGSAVADVSVYGNVILDSGLSNESHSGNGGFGIIVNRGTTGDFFANTIINTRSAGIYVQGIGHYNFYNNLIVRAGTLPGSGTGNGINWAIGDDGRIFDNTFVSSEATGVRVSSGPRQGSIFDNLIVASIGTALTPSSIPASNNLIIESLATAGFIDPEGDDYHLGPASPAVDAGSSAGYAPTDLDGVLRPQGNAADIGAFEFLPPAPGIDRFAEDPVLGLRSSFLEATPGRWAVVEDARDLRYGLVSTDYESLPDNRLGEWSLLRGGVFDDFVLSLKARTAEDLSTNQDADLALVFGWQDPDNYLYVLLNGNPGWSAISHVVNGVSRDLALVGEALLQDTAYHEIALRRAGSAITLQIDGQIRVRATAIPTQQGSIGLGSKNDAAFFDDIQLQPIVPTFLDVPFDYPYHDDIQALYQAGYTAGCNLEPLMYCPDVTMNRAESAVFVERGIHTASYDPPAPSGQIFTDLPLDSWAAKWVHGLWVDGYTAGCGSTPLIYCPWQGHTRAEAAVFYVRMLNGANFDPPQPTEAIFTDVALDSWYARWVHAADTAGLIQPCQTSPELRYCPEDPLTRAVAAYMMVRAKGLNSP